MSRLNLIGRHKGTSSNKANTAKKGGDNMLNKEYRWLLSHPELEIEYTGEYIGIVEDAIVAHGKDFKEVLKKSEKTGKEPFIYKVPPVDKLVVV